jgi:thiamine kinase-like enzyme
VYRVHVPGKIKFLIRINGEGTEHLIDRTQEEKILEESAKYNQGPKVYCRFQNGSAYEYFEGDALDPTDLPHFQQKIAENLAQFHQMNIQCVSKEATLFDSLDKWWNTVKADLGSNLQPYYDLVEDGIQYLKKQTNGFKIGFCHNDLLAPNILFEKESGIVRFIDFEYACYNFVAFDIANHFCEYQGYEFNLEQYPTKDQQLKFIQFYMNTTDSNEISKMYKQVKVCGLLSNLNWAVWAIFQSKNSKIDFDFVEYAKKRFHLYSEWRTSLENETNQ